MSIVDMRLRPRWPPFGVLTGVRASIGVPGPSANLSRSRACLLTTAAPSREVKTKEVKAKPMMWDRVVPASSRMLDFLVQEQTGAADRLVSAFQLMRFHVCRNDLRSAKSLLNSLLDGTFPVEQSGDFLPLFKMVMDAYSKVGDAAGAIHLRDLMREHGLPISKDVFFSLLRACTNARADVVTLDQFVVMLQEGAGEGWDKSPEAYVELLFMLGRAPSSEASSVRSTLPPISTMWESITSAGPTSLRATAARIEALAAQAETSSDMMADLLGALSTLPPPLRVPGVDVAMLQRACSSAARTLVRCNHVKGLRQALQSVILTESAYAELLRVARSSSSTASLVPVVLSFCDPTGPTAVLESCRQALVDEDSSALAMALRQALRLSPAEWAHTDEGDVARLLDDLQARGGHAEEVRMLGQAAAARRKSVPAPLIKSLLRCAASEGQPGRALPLLRKLGTHVTAQDYHQVMAAVGRTKLPPRMMRERSFLEDPESFIRWILKDMKDREVTAETGTINAALVVFRRACEWIERSEKDKEEAARRLEHLVDAAVEMVNACAKGGVRGEYEVVRAVEPDVQTFVKLVDVAVYGKGLKRAERLVGQMQKTGAAKEPLEHAYTAFVSAVLLRGEGVIEGEEAMMQMVNSGLSPNDAIMDAFAEAYRRSDNVASGLSMLQGCFNQYNCRPSPEAFLSLVRHGLARGDRYEAERAVVIADLFWASAAEIRTNVVGQIQARLASLEAPSKAKAKTSE